MPSFHPGRRGHSPGHLRNAFVEWAESQLVGDDLPPNNRASLRVRN